MTSLDIRSGLALAMVLSLTASCQSEEHGEEGHEEHGEDGHEEHGEEGHEEHGEEGHQEHGEEGHDEHEDEEGVVHVSAEAIARVGIVMEEATQMPLGAAVRVPAEVRAEPDRVVHLASLAEGQVAEVRVGLGERVEQGDVLAVIRSVALGEARAALTETRAEVAVAEANFERQQALVAEGIGARRDLVQAEGALRSARARAAGSSDRSRVYGRGGSGATSYLRAPIAGVVVERDVTLGEVVGPDQTLFVITDTSKVWVVGSVYPQDSAAVSEGARVTFLSPDLPSRSFAGTLDWVSPVLSERTRTTQVRVVFENEDGVLRPGLFGTLRVSGSDAEEVVTIARTGLAEIEGADAVFVPGDEEGEFEVRRVTAGRRDDERVEILAGLEAGERYVAAGVFVLKSQMLRGELGHGHAH